MNTLAILLLASAAAKSTEAPPRTIILIDESGSMVKNDPSHLGAAAVRLYADLAGTRSQVALIAFADQPRVLVPLAKSKARSVLGALDEVRYDGQTTDIEAAILAAEKMFRKSPNRGGKDTILLLTDGRVDLGRAAGQAGQKSIERLRKTIAPRLAKDGIGIYTIAFTKDADKRLMYQLSSATAGEFRFLPDASSLHTAFTELFTLAAETETLPVRDGQFLTDAEINEASVVMSRNGEGNNRIVGPNEEVLTKNSIVDGVEWRAEDAYDHVTFVDPEAGIWRIEQAAPGLREPIAIVQDSGLEFRAVIGRPVVRHGESVDLRAYFVVGGKVSRSYTLHKHLRVTATFEHESKPTQTLVLARHKDGTYRAHATLVAGRYRIVMSARSESIERQRVLTLFVEGTEPVAAKSTPQTTAEATDAKKPTHEVRIERGPWPWLFGIALVFAMVAGAFAFVTHRRGSLVMAVIAEPEVEVEAVEAPPPVEPPPPSVEWKVVLLAPEDVDALNSSKPVENPLEGGIEDACVDLEAMKTSQAQIEPVIEQLAQAAVDVTTGLQSIGSDESIPPEVIERHAELLTKLREMDGGLGQLLDANNDVTSRASTLQDRLRLFVSEAEPPAGVSHNEVNELILSRADGQTLDEFERLRQEMLDSLRNTPELLGLKSELEAKSEQMRELETTLEALQSERAALESNLEEVTEEYTRMFDEFQS